MTGRRLRCLLPILLWALCVPVHADEEALREGNRLFRRGNLEAAFEAYQAGYDGDEPVLAYNVGTTAHHLGRLPEAVLWYRRAEEVTPGGGDLWLRQNLAGARRALDAPRLPPPIPWGFLETHRHRLAWVAVALAWLSLVLLLLARRRTSRGWLHAADGTGAVALALFSATILSGLLAPTPAVLLEPCGSGDSLLAAGSEVWGRRSPETGFVVESADGGEWTCPAESMGLVRPPGGLFLLR